MDLFLVYLLYVIGIFTGLCLVYAIIAYCFFKNIWILCTLPYRPTVWGSGGALFIFLLFLLIGLTTNLFWWFWWWFLILLPIGGDWGYQAYVVKP